MAFSNSRMQYIDSPMPQTGNPLGNPRSVTECLTPVDPCMHKDCTCEMHCQSWTLKQLQIRLGMYV